MEPLKTKTTISFLWYSAGSMLYLVCQWLLGIFVVRLSGYEDAGILSLAMSVTNVYVSIAGFGMRSFQVSDAREEFSSGVYTASRVMTALVAYAVLAVFVLISHYDEPVVGAILAFGLFRAAESALDVLQGFSQRYGYLDTLGKSALMRGIGSLAAFAVSLSLGAPLFVAICSMLFVTVSVTVFYDIPVARRCCLLGPCWDRKRILLLLGKCLPLLTSSVLATIAATIPRYELERQIGNEALGQFSSVNMPALIVQVLASYLCTSMIPAFSSALAQGDCNRYLALSKRCFAALAGLAALALAVSALLGKFALHLLYGVSILPYAYLLIPAILCSVLTSFVGFFGMTLTVLRDGKGLVIINSAALITSLAVSSPLIRVFSLQGANYATMVMLVVSLGASLARYARSMKNWKRTDMNQERL